MFGSLEHSLYLCSEVLRFIQVSSFRLEGLSKGCSRRCSLCGGAGFVTKTVADAPRVEHLSVDLFFLQQCATKGAKGRRREIRDHRDHRDAGTTEKDDTQLRCCLSRPFRSFRSFRSFRPFRPFRPSCLFRLFVSSSLLFNYNDTITQTIQLSRFTNLPKPFDAKFN